MKITIHLLLLLCCFTRFAQAQDSLVGQVLDQEGKPVFAANVYFEAFPNQGVSTDFDGVFRITITPEIMESHSSGIVSFIGYEDTKFDLGAWTTANTDTLTLYLIRTKAQLESVVIKARNPISEQSAVTKITKMGIYLNPMAQADPLKAITALPSSTNTDETANPSLRGSDADQSRVILNGVPIYEPVRASQLNNQGFFSLFNPEIIDKQYVYASNPPLTYGNSSGGLVDIQTTQKVNTNHLQISTTLAGMGLLTSQKIAKKGLLQAYANRQFSTAYTAIQKAKTNHIKSFSMTDLGLNLHFPITQKIHLNSYHYGIQEAFDGIATTLNHTDDVLTGKKRYFTVNNLKYTGKNFLVQLNSGTNYAKQHYAWGNTSADGQTMQQYSAIDVKWIKGKTKLQGGMNHDYQRYTTEDQIPQYYYALSTEAPTMEAIAQLKQHNLETYLYASWAFDQWYFSLGGRTNIPLADQTNYQSMQFSIRHDLNAQHSFLLSAGQYHHYTTPNFFNRDFTLIQSRQIALDYEGAMNNGLWKAALYYKQRNNGITNDQLLKADKVSTFGLELYWEQYIFSQFKYTLSNTFLQQRQYIGETKYRSQYDLPYILKAALTYSNPKVFTFSLMYLSRSGNPYTSIQHGLLNSTSQYYEPVWSADWYGSQYKAYHRLDLSISRYFSFPNYSILPFLSINNLLDRQNERAEVYNADFSQRSFDHYQRRTIFFGVVFNFSGNRKTGNSKN